VFPATWTREYKVETISNINRIKKGESILLGKILVACRLTIFGQSSHCGTGEGWADDGNSMTSAGHRLLSEPAPALVWAATSMISRHSGSIWINTFNQ